MGTMEGTPAPSQDCPEDPQQQGRSRVPMHLSRLEHLSLASLCPTGPLQVSSWGGVPTITQAPAPPLTLPHQAPSPQHCRLTAAWPGRPCSVWGRVLGVGG